MSSCSETGFVPSTTMGKICAFQGKPLISLSKYLLNISLARPSLLRLCCAFILWHISLHCCCDYKHHSVPSSLADIVCMYELYTYTNDARAHTLCVYILQPYANVFCYVNMKKM